MKKILLSLTMAVALAASAQNGSVTYFRVQFADNLKNMHYIDGKTFFNPDRDYIDFKGSLPFTNGSTSGNVDAFSYYYIGNTPTDKTIFLLNQSDGSPAIKKVWAYTQPVENITMQRSEQKSFTQYEGDLKGYTYTFNALPRNIEELKTLEVNNREYFDDPFFVMALTVCCLNRVADNSADGWEMLNYLRTHTATVGQNGVSLVSNHEMQEIVNSNLVGNDQNGFPRVNGLRSYFEGALPTNFYTPTTPYRISVMETPYSRLEENGIQYIDLYVASGGADSPVGPIRLRQTNNHGWLLWSEIMGLTQSKKAQKEDL
ncbi:MAG: hypothetical protein K6G08_04105 [Prevotella sp.]|nr:hypothetical protein [Prevotella sp.]